MNNTMMLIRWRRRVRGRERGMSPAVELMIFIPVLVLIAGLIIAGGRIWFARATVTEAAYSGARAASIERMSSEASTAGINATNAELSTQGLECLTTKIDLDLSGFDTPVGQPASVSNSVSCRISLGDAALPGLPGSLQLVGSGTAAIDTYRER